MVELRAGDEVPEEFVAEREGARCMDQRGDGGLRGPRSADQACTIYASRPQTCRDFQRGEALCRRILGRPN
ncbi:MAG: hypothetical protein WDM96_06845 [Lacunisphaera sp.]